MPLSSRKYIGRDYLYESRIMAALERAGEISFNEWLTDLALEEIPINDHELIEKISS